MEKEPRLDVSSDTHWEDLQERFIAEAKNKEAEVLLLGDDHIALLQQSIVYRRYFVPFHTLCFGAIGDKISNLLWRLGDNLLTDSDLKVIVVSIGNSDYNLNKQQMLEGLKKVAKALKEQQPSAKIFFMELFPSGRKPNSRRQFVSQVNSDLKNTLQGLADVIDVESLLIGRDGQINTLNMFDYCHLTQEGYWLVFEPVAVTLNSIVNPNRPLLTTLFDD